MTEESVILSSDQNIEYHIVTLFEKIETLRNENSNNFSLNKLPIKTEIRTLEFWRAVISECLASFVYVFLVCGAAADGGMGTSVSSGIIATALAAGFAATSLTHCFGHISGAHINPAVTIAMAVTKKITFIRSLTFVIAECGGAIAGAAFLYGVTNPGYHGNFSSTLNHSVNGAPWQKFGVEFISTFIVVFSYMVSLSGHRKWMGNSALMIGATYSACSFVSTPYLNPARSLGPSFVMNRWDNYWVYWLGPIMGGIVSGLTYEYVFNTKRNKLSKEPTEEDSSSVHFDEDNYDDLDKPAVVTQKFHGSTYNTYRPAVAVATNATSGYCPSLTSASLYSAAPSKLECVEPLYEGTKSLYCKSPPLTRANLNRSQSVYTKSNSGVSKDFIPKPGPLVPAQSLYPIRLSQQNQAQNQNLQNQLQQRSENIYGVRGVALGSTTTSNRDDRNTLYGARNANTVEDNSQKSIGRGNRPESMYGLVSSQTRRGQSTQSDESNYSSYAPANKNSATSNNNYSNSNFQKNNGNYVRSGNSEARSNHLIGGSTSSYHHTLPQHSPSLQY